jgi:hypothetical protein
MDQKDEGLENCLDSLARLEELFICFYPILPPSNGVVIRPKAITTRRDDLHNRIYMIFTQ